MAADWSDTSLGYRNGTQFAEPFNPNDIAKNIVNLNPDLSGLVGAKPKRLKLKLGLGLGLGLGLEYQYWKNKFGNNRSGPAGSGAFAKTPMIRAEYHF